MNKRRQAAYCVLLTASGLLSGRLAGGPKIYWTDRNAGRIQRAELDGSQVETVLMNLVTPDGIAVDGVGEWVYWTENDTGKIRRAKLNGTSAQDLVTGLEVPVALTLDPVGGRMYWSDTIADLIQSSTVTGADVQTLLMTVDFAWGIGVDAASGKMYYTEDGDNVVRRADLNGSNVEVLVSAGVLSPFGLALDIAAGYMYWTDQSPPRIMRAGLDGSGATAVVRGGIIAPFGLAVDAAGGKLYWVSVSGVKIQRANLDGTAVEDIVTTGLVAPRQVALDLVPFGACCRGVLGCQSLKAHQCTAVGGLYLGDGVVCLASNTCGDASTDQCVVGAGAPDCQPDGIPDECQLVLRDCQGDGVPDSCQLLGDDDIPPGGDGAPDECNVVCTDHGDCALGLSCVGNLCQRICSVDAQCGDTSVCTYDECVGITCVSTARAYGDANGSGGQPNLDDILCVLSGFASYANCPNGDVVPACAGNDIVNLDDILAILTAFGGADPCGCAGG